MSRMFGRVCDLMRANVLEIITKSEDPEKMLRLYLDDARNHLQESQAAVATAISSEKLLDAQHAEALSAVHTWQSRAEAAVAKDRDDLAREALAEQQKAQARADQLGSALGQAHTVAENARQALLGLRTKVHDAEVNQGILIARAKAAKAQKTTAEALAHILTSDAVGSIDSMSGRVAQMEADAAAASEISGVGIPSQDERFRSIEQPAIDESLAALKAKLGKT